MQAIWYEQTGTADEVLNYGEMDTLSPGGDEVVVEIKASGVNPSDVKTRAGARGPIQFPFVIPHSDGAGEIVGVGKNVDSGRMGERVWLWNAAWNRAYGTCAEKCVLPAQQAVVLPDCISFNHGACLGVPAMTAAYGIFGDGDVSGKTILVTGGAGAVGHYAVQLAKWGGAKVITTVSNDVKSDFAKMGGADITLNYKKDDVKVAIQDVTDGLGVDRILDVEFGGNIDVSKDIIKPHGVIATYGSMADPAPRIPFYELMFKSVSIKPYLVYILPDDARARMIDILTRVLKENRLSHTVHRTFPLNKTAAAHSYIEENEFIGKIVVTI